MITFGTLMPIFSRGQRLCATDLNALREYLFRVGAAVLGRYSEGVLAGLELEPSEAGGLRLSPGAFKLGGKIGFLQSELDLPLDFLGAFKLVINEADRRESVSPCQCHTPGYSSSETVITGVEQEYSLAWVDLEGEEGKPAGLELARIRSTDGPPPRRDDEGQAKCRADGLSRLDALFDPVRRGYVLAQEVCLLYSPFACTGEFPTLRPVFQRALARIILNESLDRFHYMAPALLRGEFPVCDHVGTPSLSEALRIFYRHLKAGGSFSEESHGLDPKAKEKRPASSLPFMD